MSIVRKHFIDLSGKIAIIPMEILVQGEEISGELILNWDRGLGGFWAVELWNEQAWEA